MYKILLNLYYVSMHLLYQLLLSGKNELELLLYSNPAAIQQSGSNPGNPAILPVVACGNAGNLIETILNSLLLQKTL